MTRTALSAGDKRSGSTVPWAKIKFDRQVAAIARVAQATVVYTDDENLAATARTLNIAAMGLADLPLPPDSAQGKLPFESKAPDAIDEIAQQAKNLEEPKGPEGEAPDSA